MANNYTSYPTPPPTSSPKHTTATHHPFSPKIAAQDSYYFETEPGPETSTQTQPFQPQASQSIKAPPPAPAQETCYHQTSSLPSSPTGTSRPTGIQPPTTTSYEYLPPRRRSSPMQQPSQIPPPKPFDSTNPYYNTNPTNPSRPADPYTYTYTIQPYPQRPSSTSPQTRLSRPSSRTTTKPRTPPPRPLYFSPLNPLPTPYNTSRPLPRLGFLSRILSKLRSLLTRFKTWARRNPIKAGLATFLPFLVSAGLVKAGKALGLGGVFGSVGKVVESVVGGLVEGMGGGRPGFGIGEGGEREIGKGVRGIEKEVKKEMKKEFGWGLDHFVGFGGTKDSPLDGIMKILMMGVNHYCKLSPSAVPRVASILLELYFLERKK